MRFAGRLPLNRCARLIGRDCSGGGRLKRSRVCQSMCTVASLRTARAERNGEDDAAQDAPVGIARLWKTPACVSHKSIDVVTVSDWEFANGRNCGPHRLPHLFRRARATCVEFELTSRLANKHLDSRHRPTTSFAGVSNQQCLFGIVDRVEHKLLFPQPVPLVR